MKGRLRKIKQFIFIFQTPKPCQVGTYGASEGLESSDACEVCLQGRYVTRVALVFDL